MFKGFFGMLFDLDGDRKLSSFEKVADLGMLLEMMEETEDEYDECLDFEEYEDGEDYEDDEYEYEDY